MLHSLCGLRYHPDDHQKPPHLKVGPLVEFLPMFGAIVIVVGLMPLATAFLWLNLHGDYHRETAREAR